jgi:hypothetical protein
MIECLIENSFVLFVSHVFQQIVRINMVTNHALLLFYSYETEFINKKSLHEKNKPLDVAFNSSFCYIDDV